MSKKCQPILLAVLLMSLPFVIVASKPQPAGTKTNPAEVKTRDLRAGGNEKMRYLLMGPKAKAPAEGYALLVVMPGGGGGADFQPFVKGILEEALPDQYLVAELVAVKWTPKQQSVWPTAMTSGEGQKFTTEEFVEAVVKDVSAKEKVDRRKVFTLSWSSSGPAAYAISLQEKTSVTGSFIAMSVFKPNYLPALPAAKGRAYYIYHSPQDKTCPFRMAENARDALTEAGARVKFVTYNGGHGWSSGDPFGDIRAGVDWLDKQAAADTGSIARAAADAGKQPLTSAQAEDNAQAGIEDWLRRGEEYARSEDRMRASMPQYESVRERVRAKAIDMLKGVKPGDTDGVLALADTELQQFWDRGGLVSKDAYEYGYLARAILEAAREKDGENFMLMLRLGESIGAMSRWRHKELIRDAGPLLEKMKEQVMSGKVRPSPDAMSAMYDWTVCNFKSGKNASDAGPVLQWLVDNAQRGGWPKVKTYFEAGLENAKKNEGFVTNLWTPTGAYNDDRLAAETISLWGLQSLRPAKKYAQYMLPAWK
jgi:predicted esterase